MPLNVPGFESTTSSDDGGSKGSTIGVVIGVFMAALVVAVVGGYVAVRYYRTRMDSSTVLPMTGNVSNEEHGGLLQRRPSPPGMQGLAGMHGMQGLGSPPIQMLRKTHSTVTVIS